MNGINKIIFAEMQKIVVATLWVASTMLGWSCQTKIEAEQPLSDEQISINLSKTGKIDPDLLIGEWDAVAFACTVDGIEISNRTEISKGSLKIPDEPFVENQSDIEVFMKEPGNNGKYLWTLGCINSIGFFCLSSGGNIIDVLFCVTTLINVPTPHWEMDLVYALQTAQSFVIKGNELIFYFPKVDVEDDDEILSSFEVIEKNKTNLVIFKKNDKQ